MSSRFPPARGVIFDLDGTLVDSALDFDQMRREMGFSPGTPVLEGIAALDAEDAARCWAILEEHERAGCQRATCMPGAAELLAELAAQGFHRGLLTRNSRRFTKELIERLGLTFDAVMTRDDAPPKPDPAAIWRICERWAIEPPLAAMVGDYRFDLEAGRAAGTSHRALCRRPIARIIARLGRPGRLRAIGPASGRRFCALARRTALGLLAAGR